MIRKPSRGVSPNEFYLAACDRFINAITGTEGQAFREAFIPAAAILAESGAMVSLAQVILKATSPGVPDFYQGSEAWDFSLVDPDNRRPVNFDLRRELLRAASEKAPDALFRDWADGGIKLFVTRTLLQFRREFPGVFAQGNYRALEVEGRQKAIAFSRHDCAQGVTVVLPCRCRELSRRAGEGSFRATTVALPPASRGWRDLFTGRVIPAGPRSSLFDLFAVLPFAVLEMNP